MQQKLLTPDTSGLLAIAFRPSPRSPGLGRNARRPRSCLEPGGIFSTPVAASVRRPTPSLRCAAAAEAVDAAPAGEPRADVKLSFKVKNMCILDVESELGE